MSASSSPAARRPRRRLLLRAALSVVGLLVVAFVALDVVSRARLASAHAAWERSDADRSLDVLAMPEFPQRAESLEEWLEAFRAAGHAWSGPYSVSDEALLEEWFERAAEDDPRRGTMRRLLAFADEELGAVEESLEHSLSRGVVPAAGTAERAMLDARAVFAREVNAVALRIGEAGGRSPRSDTDRYVEDVEDPLPAFFPAGMLEAQDLAGTLPLSAAAPTSLERGVADLEAVVAAAERLVGGPSMIECYSRGLIVQLALPHVPVLVQAATTERDSVALDRIDRALGAFAPLERLRTAARVQHLLAHEFFEARERSRAESKRYATWLQEFGLVPGGWLAGRAAWKEGLLAAVHPLRVPVYRLEHAAFHRGRPELEARIARGWWESGSLAAERDPRPEDSASHAEHVLQKSLFGAYVWAVWSEAALNAARCAVAYGRGGEAALDEALEVHRDPFTGEPFERGVGEDGIAELRSPGTPLLDGPIAWPLPRR